MADRLALEQEPEFNSALRAPEDGALHQARAVLLYPMRVKGWLRDLGVLTPPPVSPSAPQAKARRLRRDIIGRLRGGLSLSPIKKSRVMEIAFTSGDAALSAAVVNAVAEQYILDQLDAKLDAARAATDWLSGRVQELQERVQDAEEAVELTRAQLSIAAGQGSELTRDQIDALNQTLADANAALADRRAQLDAARGALENGDDLGSVTVFRRSGTIQNLRVDENRIERQVATMAASVGAGHPALRRLEARLAQTRSGIRAEAERIVAALDKDFSAAEAEADELAEDLRRLETKSLDQSHTELKLRQLEREAQASRLLYQTFLSRLNETADQQTLQSADARILSPGEQPSYADAAPRSRLIMLCGMGGAVLGLGLVLLLERLNNTFRTPSQIEAVTGQSVLAELPSLGSGLARAQVLAHLRAHPQTPLAEAARYLRTSLLLGEGASAPKVVMFTSSNPQEGKSTMSILTAITSRQMGRSVVLIDCDLRLPALGNAFGAGPDQPGLMHVLDGRATLDEAVISDAESGLHVVTAGVGDARRDSAADILASHRFAALIEELTARYDVVVIDTPPVLAVTDARIVAGLSDAVIYAVRWGVATHEAVREGCASCSASGRRWRILC